MRTIVATFALLLACTDPPPPPEPAPAPLQPQTPRDPAAIERTQQNWNKLRDAAGRISQDKVEFERLHRAGAELRREAQTLANDAAELSEVIGSPKNAGDRYAMWASAMTKVVRAASGPVPNACPVSAAWYPARAASK